MPELPEVETVCRGLRESLVGEVFSHVEKYREDLRIPFPANLSYQLEGHKIIAVKRRAKYILIELDNDIVIIAHLGMSGKFILHNAFRNWKDKHDHVVFRFSNGIELVLNDPRRFGLLTTANKNEINSHKLIAHLGIEPLEDGFNHKVLYRLLQKKNIPVKNAIMDAGLVVGVGNIYACESLFDSGISPFRKASEISPEECKKLTTAIKEILQKAIIAGGSTLKDYANSSGEAGYFQHSFKVYGKDKEACIVCNKEIKRQKQSGRSTFFCGNCQK